MTRVLIIDAEQTRSAAWAVSLRDSRFEIATAASLEEAWTALRNATPALVLCSTAFSHDEHLSFCRQLKNESRFREIVLVVYSNRVNPEQVLRSLEAGADDFVSLLRSPEELAEFIERVVARGPRTVPASDSLHLSFRGRHFHLAMDRQSLFDVLVSSFEDLQRVNEQLEQEIERRRLAEEESNRTQERFDLAVRGAGDGIWDWDVRRNVVYLSARWKEMLGFQDHELANSFETWEERLHPVDRDRALGSIRDYFDGRTDFYELEHRLRHKDGSYRWILARGRVLRDGQGQPLRMSGSNTDITDRKVVEEELRMREAQLREFNRVLMNLAIDECILGDDLGAAMRRFTRITARTLCVSRCSIWLFNDDRSELVCRNLYESETDRHTEGLVIEAAHFPRYLQALEAEQIIAADDAAADPRTGAFTESYLIPLGITSMLDAPLRLRGKIVGVLCHEHVGVARRWSQEEQNFAVSVASLISLSLEANERKRAESEARAAHAAAEAANRAKSAFLANMSHEIRTPMNAIIGMTELALDSELTPEQAEYLELVAKSADNLLTIVNEILDFSKIEAGRLELEHRPFNLHELIGDVMGTLAPRAYQKGLELAGCVAVEIPEFVIGDAIRLRQVVMNLVGNAIKFTEQGEIFVEARLAKMGEPCAMGLVCVTFTVTDTGIGIPPDKINLIFDPFAQADSSTTRKYGGTGLGLTISARLVEAMGGIIQVVSEPGRGSTFEFTLAFNLLADHERRAPEVEWKQVQGLTALVVDDNATNRRILDETLRHWEITPTCVADGPSALRVLETAYQSGKPFELVLLDVNMPGMDGFDLAEAIRVRPELAGATIMMLTSGGRPGDALRCRELGVRSFLTKPVRRAELKRAIQQALAPARETLRSPARQSDSAISAYRTPPLRILLAEDNPVNQRLVVRLLEKQHHAVTIAANGREALERWQREPFDVILMDVQMPEMDGLQAASAIRERELSVGGHIPILAMTAYAMRGDRDRCLDAGMDAYIAKPIRSEEMYDAIRRLVGASNGASVGRAELSRDNELKQAIDWAQAMAYVGNDVELLRDLTRTFLDECPRWRAGIDRAVSGRDAKALLDSAHPFKNSLAVLGAEATGRLAAKLEQMGRTGDLTEATEILGQLDNELNRILPTLRRFAQSTT